MYYLLTAAFKSQETKLAARICRQPGVEKIYLLGSTLIQRRTESVFMPDAPASEKAGHYQLLVLLNKNNHLPLHDLQDRIENACRSLVPVTALVLQLDTFIGWLRQRNLFAATVVEKAVLLYCKDNIPLLLPAPQPAANNPGNLAARQQHMVSAFISGAELYLQQKQQHLAMFMLHQAAEHALHLLLKQRMHWHTQTHNLDKLLRFAAMVCHGLQDIFNRDSEEEESLLQQLQDAYISSRYREAYQSSAATALKALEKVKRLQQITAAGL